MIHVCAAAPGGESKIEVCGLPGNFNRIFGLHTADNNNEANIFTRAHLLCWRFKRAGDPDHDESIEQL